MEAMQVETASQGEAAAALAEDTAALASRAILVTVLLSVLGTVLAVGLGYVVARGSSVGSVPCRRASRPPAAVT